MDKMDINTVRELARSYRNWGKWGAGDELGTLNYITPEKIVAAAKLVRHGKVFSLAIPFDSNGPQTGFGGRINPLHFMLQDGGDVASGAQDFIPGAALLRRRGHHAAAVRDAVGRARRTSTSTARCTTTAAPRW